VARGENSTTRVRGLPLSLRVGVNVVRAVIWVTIWLQVEETSEKQGSRQIGL
jgi:cell division protein FtsN